MKKLLFILIPMFITVILLFNGCGNSKQTIETEQGPITVEQKGEESSEVGKGNTTADVGEEKEPTEEDLGLGIYEGAEYVAGSGKQADITSDGGKMRLIAGEFITSDPFDKVGEWYRASLGEPGILSENEMSWFYRIDSEGSVSGVTLKAEDGKVKITLYKTTKISS